MFVFGRVRVRVCVCACACMFFLCPIEHALFYDGCRRWRHAGAVSSCSYLAGAGSVAGNKRRDARNEGMILGISLVAEERLKAFASLPCRGTCGGPGARSSASHGREYVCRGHGTCSFWGVECLEIHVLGTNAPDGGY